MSADLPTSQFQPGSSRRAGADSQPEPPSHVPGYEIRDFVGKGAYGQVWTAVDRNTGRRVAIKFFAHRASVDGSLLSSEVEKLVFLSSDRYVVQLLEVGWDAEPPYYVMEYVEDGSLSDRLQDSGPIPAREAAHIFHEIAIGLSHAHSKGVLHCDLKPANVLLDQDNRPRLADFGQSRLTGEQSPALGTLFFMAPEQADLGAVADASWDVYALGSLLYCMLTGSPAHRSDSTINYIESASELSEQLARYRTSLHQSPAPEAHRRVPGVDRALADIVDKCLALHPSDRYPNVFAVLQALESRAQVRHRRPLWILGLVGPLLLLLTMSFFGYRGYQRAIREANTLAVRGAQASNQFAARLGARAVANEMDRRFRAVKQAAADPQFVASIERFLASDGVAEYRARVANPKAASEVSKADRDKFSLHPDRQPIQQYIKGLLNGPDASWFVTDALGTHLAAAFRDETQTSSIGGNYAWRTYFHGGPADFDKDFAERGDRSVGPIQSVHLSAVFRSTVTTKWKVAISAPVRNDENTIIGIVAMTVELGELFVEEFAQDDSQPKGQQYAVVVDGRQGDHQGVILQHPLYDRLVADGLSVPDHHTGHEFRVDLDILRNQESLVRYEDPLSRDAKLGSSFTGDWIVGVAPIRIEQTRQRDSKQVTDTGLWVLVQERLGEITAPVESLAWRMLREAGWALAIVCTVTLVLLLLVRNMMYDSLHTGAGKFVGTTESTIHSRETLEQPRENRSR